MRIATRAVAVAVLDNCLRKYWSIPRKDMNIFSRDEDGDTDLHIGIIKREKSTVLNIIGMAPTSDCLDIKNDLRQAPLHIAVFTRQVEIIRRLMVACASLESRDQRGNTPLHVACQRGYDDIVELLLTPVRYDETIHNKSGGQNKQIPQDLTLKNYDGHTCVHLAALATSLRSLDALVAAGADINMGDGRSGRSVLHHAVEDGNRVLLQYLMTCERVNVNLTTYSGSTPIQLAYGRGHMDIVNMLVDHGADLDHSSDTQ